MRYEEPRDVSDLPLSEDYFESLALKGAVWQYLIDHARPVGRGMARVMFHIQTKNPGDLWRRVRARKEGRFKRTELSDFEKEQNRIDKEYITWSYLQERRRKQDKYLRSLQKTGPLHYRFLALSVMWLRSLAYHIHKYLTKNVK